MNNKTKVRVFSIIVVGYMLAALVWWALLLNRKTNTIYELQSLHPHNYPSFEEEYVRQQYMIFGEAIVIGGAMILGIILLNRAFKREMVAVKQQKNFLLSVTHELKSPITAIRLILDTFKRKKLNQEQTSVLIQNGQMEADRLHKLVEDLLMAARLNPKTTLVLESVNVHHIIEDLLASYQRNYPAFEFKFVREGSHYTAKTNESSLYLIVSNILDNAVKYSYKHKMVIIRLYNKNQEIRLTIEDQGQGIPEAEKRKIFDQFYRIGDENIRTSQGTGLGLYLVNELSSKLNMKVMVRDNEPEGTIFELAIPMK
ncbi:sensor histidine kinase [Portibacter marinus]|uniref:sensor histidine kinase n=1 Tax=Portibacter marinus TaxID=2898660 RepID=UPI001F42B7F7|nr:HAMP domain-containing sensor histidine kinase [Portibacter marinus]